MTHVQIPRPAALATGVLLVALGAPVLGQERGLTYTLYGTPGLIEMPTALSAGDGRIAATFSYFGGNLRNTLTFQATPRLSGSFRYGGIEDFRADEEGWYFDRSFDVRYRLTDEGDLMPAIAIGLQDFLGTGLYSGEYVVATKTFGDNLRATVGLGWGRLATSGAFDNPLGALSSDFETRPEVFIAGETGGDLSPETWFHGQAAVFGGVEWAWTDTIMLKAEYSSDGSYQDNAGEDLVDQRSQVNLGVSWRPSDMFQLSGAWLYGSELALSATMVLDPLSRANPGLDAAPLPVTLRSPAERAETTWDRSEEPAIRARLAEVLLADGLVLRALELTDTTARLRFANERYRAQAQAIGRAARAASGILPPSIEWLILEPEVDGLPIVAATLSRSDLEAFETRAGGTAAMRDRLALSSPGPEAGLQALPAVDPALAWRISPYAGLTVFDGESPIALDVGLQFSAEYRLRPDLILSGMVRKSLLPEGDLGTITNTTLPPVRSNAPLYARDGDPGIHHLTLAHYLTPGENLYGRVTAGYLEPMFAGVSGELLWAPPNRRYALGAELNYAVQRDYDMLFGLQDYDVVTGHASLYYDFSNGFHGQIDAGRYLAGDWGATFTLDREFQNGWRVGGYFTLTDASAEEFGEGSFDKGLRVTIPIDFYVGHPTRAEVANTLQSLRRDGGARLEVDGRLYDTVREGLSPDLDDGFGRFWR